MLSFSDSILECDFFVVSLFIVNTLAKFSWPDDLVKHLKDNHFVVSKHCQG